MFTEHYGLKEDPFGVTPDPRFLYFGREHLEAMSTLYLGIVNGRGFTVMIAPPGMGKTTLLHNLREKIRDWADTAFLFCSFDDKNELLQAVMAALSVDPDGGRYFDNWRRLQRHLEKRFDLGRKTVLVFDEAQRFSNAMLENIRMFSNLETAQSKLVQIVLAGQPPLMQKLQAPELEQLGQRIGVYGRILPLDENEVESYMNHRLGVAGRTERLFTPEAVSLIAHRSGGVPRNINTICYNAMANGWVLGIDMIDEEIVEQAARGLDLAGANKDSLARKFSRRDEAPIQTALPADGPNWRLETLARLQAEWTPGRAPDTANAGIRASLVATGIKLERAAGLAGEAHPHPQPNSLDVREAISDIVESPTCELARAKDRDDSLQAVEQAGEESWDDLFQTGEHARQKDGEYALATGEKESSDLDRENALCPAEKSEVEASPLEAPLVDAGLVDAGMVEAAMVEVSLVDAGMVDASLVEASVVAAGLVDAGVVEAGVVEAGVVDASLVEASLVDAGVAEAGVVAAGLVAAGLVAAGLVDAGLVDAGLVDAGLVEASLVEASLVDAGMVGASVGEASPVDGSLVDASLVEASLARDRSLAAAAMALQMLAPPAPIPTVPRSQGLALAVSVFLLVGTAGVVGVGVRTSPNVPPPVRSALPIALSQTATAEEAGGASSPSPPELGPPADSVNPQTAVIPEDGSSPPSAGIPTMPGGASNAVPAAAVEPLVSASPASPPEAPPPSVQRESPKARPPARVRAGGNFQQAKLVGMPIPTLPPLAKERGIYGVVKLEATITKQGTVKAVTVLSGNPFLNASAIEEAMQWRYRPALRNGEPVEIKLPVQIVFRPDP